MNTQLLKAMSAKQVTSAGRQRVSPESGLLPLRRLVSSGRYAATRTAHNFRATEQHSVRDNAFLIA